MFSQQIKFSSVKAIETLDNKIKSKLYHNIYFIPYLLFIIWLFFTACLYSYRYI